MNPAPTRRASHDEVLQHARGVRDVGLCPVEDAVLAHLSASSACTATDVALAAGVGNPGLRAQD